MKTTIAVILSVLVLILLWINAGPKHVQGQVVDSITGKGIEGVTVRALQRGWGWSGYLVWDKDYTTTATTDRDGRFSFWYCRGGTSAHLQFSKDGYRSTKAGYKLQDTYIDFWESPTVMLQAD